MNERSHPEPEYRTAHQFLEGSFAANRSYLYPQRECWVPEKLSATADALMSPDDLAGSKYLDRLRSQLQDADDDLYVLAAESYMLYLLFPNEETITANFKRTAIRQILSWRSLADPGLLLDDAFGSGIGRPGMHYKQYPPYPMSFFLRFAAYGKERPINFFDRVACEKLATEISLGVKHMQEAPHALLHLFFPNEYEPIVSGGHKALIVGRYGTAHEKAGNADEALREIRTRMSNEHGANFSFYAPDLKPQWEAKPTTPTNEAVVTRVVPKINTLDDSTAYNKLVDTTLWTEAALQEVLNALPPTGDARQIVFSGPPGTGKTWVARAIVNYLTRGDVNLNRLVQFHPSYSYEQFVEGLRPVADEGVVKFDVAPGIVRRMAKMCAADKRDHFLIIDEINRGNLPRVLGELLYLFEYRDESIDLPYTEGFALPANLIFVGTMNTADRSIRSMDTALRRRFDIFDCAPSEAIIRAYYGRPENELTGLSLDELVSGFVQLNELLTKALDAHHTIGHTFFMDRDFTPGRLRTVWNRKLKPLIEEYFFDQADEARSFRAEDLWPNLNST